MKIAEFLEQNELKTSVKDESHLQDFINFSFRHDTDYRWSSNLSRTFL